MKLCRSIILGYSLIVSAILLVGVTFWGLFLAPKEVSDFILRLTNFITIIIAAGVLVVTGKILVENPNVRRADEIIMKTIEDLAKEELESS